MQKLTILCVALALVAVGCSSGQPAPTPGAVATYGPSSQNPPPPPPRYAASQPVRTAAPGYQPAPAYAPAPAYGAQPSYGGAFQWHNRIANAQAQARRENKLILVGSTKPGCGLCDKFKDQIVPQAGTRVSSIAVGYMCQAGAAAEAPYIWQQLRANLPNAGLMPLVGVFTPDLRYLTGFGGPPDNQQLMNALSTARRLYPVSVRVPQPAVPAPAVAGTTARLNEYGEYEWTPLEELYPRPEDALTPEAAVAVEPVLPPAPAPVVAPAPTAVAVVHSAPPPPPASAPVAVVAPKPSVPVVSAPAPVAATPKAAARPRPPFSREPEPALEAWGAQALRQALDQIQSGDLDAAKATLAEVRARLPGSTLAREAAKGGVAIYNASRIAGAEGGERERLRAEAERNLGQTMWGVLFRS